MSAEILRINIAALVGQCLHTHADVINVSIMCKNTRAERSDLSIKANALSFIVISLVACSNNLQFYISPNIKIIL